MREGRVEAEQDREGLTPALGRRHGLTVKGRLLDRGGGGHDLPIRHPGPALGVELGGVEPIECLAEAVGVVLAHT